MYTVQLQYQHRDRGEEGRTMEIDSGSMAAAIGKAAREFVKSLDRKERFDAKKGLTIVCTAGVEPKAEAPGER